MRLILPFMVYLLCCYTLPKCPLASLASCVCVSLQMQVASCPLAAHAPHSHGVVCRCGGRRVHSSMCLHC